MNQPTRPRPGAPSARGTRARHPSAFWVSSSTARRAARTCLLATLAGSILGFRSVGAAEDLESPVTRARVWAGAELERGPHHQVVETISEFRHATGRVTRQTNRVHVLASGLFYRHDGKWVRSSETLELTTDGAVARHGPHTVTLPHDLAGDAPVEMLTSDRKRFRSRLLGLTYLDPASGSRVWLARTQPCRLELAAPNRAIYRGALAGHIEADAVYHYRQGSFSQDVVLRQRLPGPEAWGLDPVRTRLEVVTEFVEAPEPVRHRAVVVPEPDAATRARMVEPDWTDDRLEFGAYWMGPSRAFALGTDEPTPLPIAKRWETVEGRTFLFESLRYDAVRPLSDRLPPAAPAPGTPLAKRDPTLAMTAPPAAPGSTAPGLVLDYTLLTGAPSLTLECDTTYLVLGPVETLALTIEGGAVVKFTNATATPYLRASGFDCQAASYRPAVFTAKDDDSVGEVVPSSTGHVRGFYGAPALKVNYYDSTLEHLRFAACQTAIEYEPATLGTRHALRHVQFVRCETAVRANGYASSVPCQLLAGNLLFAGLTNGFDGGFYSATLEHLTANGVGTLANVSATRGWPVTVQVDNSVLAHVVAWAGPLVSVTGAYNGFHSNTVAEFGEPRWISTNSPFQAVGAGRHYLAPDSLFRDQGRTNLEPTLAEALPALTTTAPTVWSGPITNDTTLSLRVERDTLLPDLGWHYAPMDFVFSDVALSDATLTLTNGVVLGVHGARGLELRAGSRFVSAGSATALNRVVWYNTVQDPIAPEWAGPPGHSLHIPFGLPDPAPQVDCQYTQWSMLGIGFQGYHVYVTAELSSPVTFADCQFGGGSLAVLRSPTTLRNCLWDRAYVILDDKTNAPARTLHNNLFRGGSLELAGNGGAWVIQDNLFDRTTLYGDAGTNAVPDYNAYVEGHSRWAGPHDVVLPSSPAYQTGPLGGYYQPADSPLLDAGSRTTGQAGLAQHTVLAAGTPASGDNPPAVAVGFHYVACTGNVPRDTDTDGLPDYVEDLNGNGLLDTATGESSVTQADTDGDGLGDLQSWELRFNVLVNDPAQDFGNEQNTQFETACIVHQGTVVVGYVDANLGVYGLGGFDTLLPLPPRFVGYSYSPFGGVSFLDPGAPPVWTHDPATAADDGDAGDPVLAVDPTLGPRGTVYLTGTSPRHSGFRGLPVWKSTDGGRTFGNPTTVRDDLLATDKPWLAVDTAEGPGQHDLYVTCQAFGATNALWLTISTNGGGDWATPLPIRFKDTNVVDIASPIVTLSPDHVGYLVWYEADATNQAWLRMRTSRDRGATPLGPVTDVVRLKTTGRPYGDLVLRRSNTAADDDTFRVYPFPVVAVNPRPANAQHLYVAYPDHGEGTDRADVYLACSRDGGTNWNAPRVISTRRDQDQWMPVLAVKPDGTRLFLAWYDRRDDPANSRMHVYGRWATVADDGSVQFETEFRLTTESFAMVFGGTLPDNRPDGHYDPVYPPGGVNLHWHYPQWPLPDDFDDYLTADTYARHVGEYNGAFADEQYVYVTWTDYRSPSRGTLYPGRLQSDIRMVRITWP